MNAPVLPRRALLAGLATLPVSIPAAAMKAISPDAALIALASKAMVLNDLHDAALEHEAKIDDRLSAEAWRSRPAEPALTNGVVTIDRQPDGSFSLHSVEPPADAIAANKAMQEEHAQAMAAWEAEREAAIRRSGLRTAHQASQRADQRLTAACVALTAMKATTLPGLAAKGRVTLAVNPDRAYSAPWMEDLSASVVRDLVAIGGAA